MARIHNRLQMDRITRLRTLDRFVNRLRLGAGADIRGRKWRGELGQQQRSVELERVFHGEPCESQSVSLASVSVSAVFPSAR